VGRRERMPDRPPAGSTGGRPQRRARAPSRHARCSARAAGARRCPRPDSQFRAVAMGREERAPAADGGVAARTAFQPRGRAHAFALNALAA